jgi:hypothetical protein
MPDLTLVISICFAGILYLIAEKRGLNKVVWTILGLMIGPLALIVIFFVKKPTKG